MMRRVVLGLAVLAFGFASAKPIRADVNDKEATAVLDKAIKALGGEEKLSKGKGFSWRAKGVLSFGGSDNDFTTDGTAEGIDHYRSTFSGDFGGNQVEGVSVLNGTKGWRKFNDMSMELEGEALDSEKRSVYLRVAPTLVLPLKGDKFKVISAGEEKAGDVVHNVLKITGPDSKDFRLYFEKESGLPVKLVANVSGFMGEEYEQTTTYKDYKDFGGVQKATKVESKRDGEKFIEETISEFKLLDSVDPKSFAEPE